MKCFSTNPTSESTQDPDRNRPVSSLKIAIVGVLAGGLPAAAKVDRADGEVR
ncbi:hypothetical protein CCACVL1_14675 [Corchorus capsularis]|uniref:Uncharacterized protein n=1 Tax=Corchorus capsularis TaxID=210143 RepID=A0A1R3I661_COCAP|nr:hypothetical protein CCACVL1_14675 [Corchorus capsularis]